ncbi:MAG: hypothetical protein IKQ36_04160 [Clostridia bacterium]|nr:hypothetical protein [Clostridia bacterium]
MNIISERIRRLLAVLLCAALAFTTLGITALAKVDDDFDTRGYTYIDENGNVKKLPNTVTTIDVTSDLTTWNVTNAWYIVSGEVTINATVYAEGAVNLLLLDGAKLTINAPINIDTGNTLRIFAQSTENEKGILTTKGSSNTGYCGIQVDGTLIINGGSITASGYAISNLKGPGIGSVGSFGNIIINGGNITAYGAAYSTSSNGSCGIGYGSGSVSEGCITINGGTVYASGGGSGSTRGNGIGTYKSPVSINGGNVIAIGRCGISVTGGSLTVSGGSLLTTGSYDAGISVKTISISESDVTATGSAGPGIYASESINIESGDVTARAGSGSYGMQAPEINLGWQNRYRDYINCSSYNGTVTFTDEFVLADMFGQATDVIATPDNINGNVIMPDPLTDYIDENGDVQSRRDFFLLDSMEEGELELQDYWYLVPDDVDIENVCVTVDGDAHILLLNGAELSVPQGFSVPDGSSLGIYMQPHDTVDEIGKLVSGSVEGGDLGVYGGIVDIDGGVTGNAEFKAGLITLRDGEDYGTASGNINIAISNDGDRITAAGFTGSVTVANNLVMLNADGTASDSYVAAGEYEDLEFTDLHTAKVFDGVIPDPSAVDPVSFTVDSVTALPGGECSVDVSIEGEYEASALTLLVHYDPDLLTVEAIEPGEVCQAMSAAGGLINTDITGTPGTAKFIAVMPIDAVSAEGCIFTLNFRVSGEAEGGTEIPITVEVLQFYFMPLDSTSITNISYEVTNGIVTVSYLPGDVNLDGVLDTTDVILVMRNVLEIVEFNDTQAALADFNGDGAIDATDALMMMRAILDLL